MRIWVIEYQFTSGDWEPMSNQSPFFDENAAKTRAAIFSDENNHYRAAPYIREEADNNGKA